MAVEKEGTLAGGAHTPEEEDYETRIVQDAIRRTHDEELAARAKLAIIRSDMEQFKQMFDDADSPFPSLRGSTGLRRIMDDSDSPAGQPQSQSSRENPPGSADVDAFYRKLRSQVEVKTGIIPEQLRERINRKKAGAGEAGEETIQKKA